MKYVIEDVHLLSANYYSKPMVVKAERMHKWDKIPGRIASKKSMAASTFQDQYPPI
jgi:hypothetical protein